MTTGHTMDDQTRRRITATRHHRPSAYNAYEDQHPHRSDQIAFCSDLGGEWMAAGWRPFFDDAPPLVNGEGHGFLIERDGVRLYVQVDIVDYDAATDQPLPDGPDDV